eukprot:410966_1
MDAVAVSCSPPCFSAAPPPVPRSQLQPVQNTNISIKRVTCKLKPYVKERIDSFITGFIRELTLHQNVPNEIKLSILSLLMDLQHIVMELDNISANYIAGTCVFEIRIDSFLPKLYDNINYKLQTSTYTHIIQNESTINWSYDNIYDQKCIAFVTCDFLNTIHWGRFEYQLSIIHNQSILTVSDWTPYHVNFPPPVPLNSLPVHRVKHFISTIKSNNDSINLKQWLNGLISYNICTDKDVMNYKCLFYYIQFHKQHTNAPFIITAHDLDGFLSQADMNNNKYQSMQNTLREFIFAISHPPPPIPKVIECIETVKCTLKPCVKARMDSFIIGFIRELILTQNVSTEIILLILSIIMDLQHITIELNHITDRLFEIRIDSFLPKFYNDIKYKLECKSQQFYRNTINWSGDNIYDQGCVTFMQCSFANKYCRFQYQVSIMHKQSILTVSDWTPYHVNFPPPVPLNSLPVHRVKHFISTIKSNNDSINLKQWLNGLILCNICNDEDLILTDYKCLFYYIQFHKQHTNAPFIITAHDLDGFLSQADMNNNKYQSMQNTLREFIFAISHPPPPIPKVIECIETVKCTLKPCVKARMDSFIIGFIRELILTQNVSTEIILLILSIIMDLQHITIELNHITDRLFEIRIDSFLPKFYNDIKYKLECKSQQFYRNTINWSGDNIYDQGCVTFMQCCFVYKYCRFQYQISIMYKQSILSVSDWTPYDGNIPPAMAPVGGLMLKRKEVKYFISKIGGKDYCVNLEQWLNGLISYNICNDEDLILTDYKCLFYYMQYCKQNKNAPFIITVQDLDAFIRPYMEQGHRSRHKNKYKKMQNKLIDIVVPSTNTDYGHID